MDNSQLVKVDVLRIDLPGDPGKSSVSQSESVRIKAMSLLEAIKMLYNRSERQDSVREHYCGADPCRV